MALYTTANSKSLKNFPIEDIRRDYENFPRMFDYSEQDGTSRSSTELATPAFFTRVIDGWSTFINPHTPPHGVTCSPDGTLWNYVSMLFRGIVLVLETHDRKQVVAASSRILPMWPSIWIWLQTFRAHDLRPRSLLPEERDPPDQPNSHGVIIKVLFAIIYSEPITPLLNLVKETKEVTEMLAAIWIEEGVDTTSAKGFRASLLLQPQPSRSPESSYILPEIVSQCRGSAENAVGILLRRIKHNVRQAEPDWTAFRSDASLVMDQHERNDTPYKVLREAILSHPAFIATMVDALSLLVQVKKTPPVAESDTFRDLLRYPLASIYRHCQIRGHHSVVQLMGTTIISIIARLAQTHGSDANVVQTCNQLLGAVIGRFSIHRPILLAASENLRATDSPYKMPKGIIGHRLRSLILRVQSWKQILETQPLHALDCGNSQCKETDSGHNFRRCSGCKLVQYCSAACQRTHWLEQHKILCSEMCSSKRSEPISLSGPDLRFFTHVLAHDCMSLQPAQRRTFEKTPSLNPTNSPSNAARTSIILMLDYEKIALQITQKRLSLDILDLNESPNNITRVFQGTLGPTATEAWHGAWARTALRPAATSRTVVPVLAILPRGWDAPQVMTAVCTFHNDKSGKLSKSKPHIRWVHRM